MEQKFDVTGMTCSACSAHVEKAVRKVPGVSKVTVNLLSNQMAVEYDENTTNANEIIQSVEQAGYGASVHGAQDKKMSVGKEKDPMAEQIAEMKRRLILSFCFMIPLMYVSMGHMAGLPLPGWLHGTENAMSFALTQFLLTLPEGHQVKDFSLDAGTGAAALRQLAIPELDLSTDTGYFFLEDVSSETMEITCSTGEVKGKNLVISRETEISLSTGSVSLSGDLSGEIEVENSTGEIELSLRQPRDAYVLSGKVSPTGSIQVDGEPFSGSDVPVEGKHSLRVGGSVTDISLWFDSEGPEA